jgi:hypothetical protein
MKVATLVEQQSVLKQMVEVGGGESTVVGACDLPTCDLSVWLSA